MKPAPANGSEVPGVEVCYVRIAGPLRTTTVKLLYRSNVQMRDLEEVARKLGRIKAVEFPKTPLPVTLQELSTAKAEGRFLERTDH